MGIIIALIIVFIIALILFAPVTCEYTFSLIDGKKINSFRVGFLLIKKDIKKKEKTKENKKEKSSDFDIFNKIKEYKEEYDILKEDIKKILIILKDKAIKIKKVSTNIHFSAGDAMKTGICTGILNGILYNLMAVLYNGIGIDDWNVFIKPEFDENQYIDIKIDCIVKIKLVHIIFILIKSFGVYRKHKNFKITYRKEE